MTDKIIIVNWAIVDESDERSVMNSGKLFHARGPATAKALTEAMNDVLLADGKTYYQSRPD